MSTPNNSHEPTDWDAKLSSDHQAAAGRIRDDEDEPLIQMLLRQQEESTRLQEERHHSLRQEMNERMNTFFETSQHSKEAVKNIPSTRPSGQESFGDIKSKVATMGENPGGGSTMAIDENTERFDDDIGSMPANDVQYARGNIGGIISKRSNQVAVGAETNSWMYDLGKNNAIFPAKMSVVKTTGNNKEEGLTISFGDNDGQQQKGQQMRRRNFVTVDEEEFFSAKDHRKQQDERIRLLEAKIRKIEKEKNAGSTATSLKHRRYSIFRTFTELDSNQKNSDFFSRDTFTMMILNKISSRSWILGTISFFFQMTLGSMIAINQFKASTGTSIFDVPFKVDTEVRVVQFLSIILCLSIQSDILTSIKSLVLLGRDSNWRQAIGIDERSSRDSASCGLWAFRIGIPNTMKLVQGLTVTFVSFVIIVQAHTSIDLLKDFTALMIVSETDNILYQLAAYGYLGEKLYQEALQIEQKTESTSDGSTDDTPATNKSNGLLYVRLVFLLLLGAMFGGWGIIFHNQITGVYFKQKFPGCVSYELALDYFGDGVCYGGTLNTIECKFEDGDCINYNTAYPNCKGKGLEGLVNVEDEIGNGKCNMEFANPECDYDGGLCCPYDIHRSQNFRDGQCHSGIISSIGCDLDGGDCLDFIKAYPQCNIESGADGTVFGNDICEGGGYTTEECGYENGDCDVGQIGGDLSITGIFSPFDKTFNFYTKLSGDGSMLFINMPQTSQSGKFDRDALGRVIVYRYDTDDKRWVEQMNLEGDKRVSSRDACRNTRPASWAVNENGNMVAIGFYWYGTNKGQVNVYDFKTNGSSPRDILFGIEGNEVETDFGFQVDMTNDGSRVAVSSNDTYYRKGRIQVFQWNRSEKVWAQVGESIFGKTDGQYIGYTNLRLNSLDGNRVFFTAFSIQYSSYYYSQEEKDNNVFYIRAYELNIKSNQWTQIGDDIASNLDHYSSTLVVSANGSRIATSSYSNTTTRPGEVKVFDLVTDPISNKRKWSQLGRTMFQTYSKRKYVGSAGDGFGRDISMSADGNILAITSVKPSCDGVNPAEGLIVFCGGSPTDAELLTISGLCATGSVQIYKYKSTNPPHRPFAQLPYKRDNYFRSILEESERERDGTILGLDVSLSGDGSRFSVNGLDLNSKNGFVKVYNVADLFYVDCLIQQPNTIGDGECFPFDLHYTEECGYDGGDCPPPSPVDGFDDCKVSDPSLIGDGECDDWPYASVQCGYDDGDCPPPSPVGGYPNCFVYRPQSIGDGICDLELPYDSYDCGFDGGDCLPEDYASTSSPSKSTLPSQSPSFTSSPTQSIHPSHSPSNGPSHGPSLSHTPSQSTSPSEHPSISAMPTSINMILYFQFRTDYYSGDTSWSLINESDGGTVIAMGPSDDDRYKRETLYNYTWILSRCTSYKFKIFDSVGDGFGSDQYGYAALAFDGGRGIEILGITEGNFGDEWSMDIYICDP